MSIRTASASRRALAISVGVAAFVSLTGCTSGTPTPTAEPPSDAPAAACEIGHWVLDVADFESQVVPFLEGTGIPIVDYAMSGDGQLDIADDGFIDGAVSLRSTGTIDPGGVPPTPVDVTSSYTFSGNWAPGETAGTLDLSNWAQVADPGVPVDELGVIPSFFDFTDIPSVSSDCTADTLRLQGPDAPFSALWHRS
jgi:hypothetical protein